MKNVLVRLHLNPRLDYAEGLQPRLSFIGKFDIACKMRHSSGVFLLTTFY